MALNTDTDIDALISETEKTCVRDENISNTNLQKQIEDRKTCEIVNDSDADFDCAINQENINLDSKQKKKLDKFLDNLFKKSGLTNNSSIEDKFYALANKYNDLLDKTKQNENKANETSKNLSAITKQRDQLQHDYSKALLARNKLESLCRELQRHNKAIKEENITRTKEEEEKRKEISNKFQAAIDEINQQVNSNTERNNALIQENVQLAAKLKTLLEQYETREQHIDKVLKHKDLENQLMNAKFQQAELKVVELTERNKKYEEHIHELNKRCEFHIEAENQLKLQLKLYTDKYEEFQAILNKSNKDFGTFRSEMEKMTKKIKKLEQETTLWKTKWETTNKSLIQVAEQKDELEKESKKNKLKADTLEQLCRTLQTERTDFIQKLKSFENLTNNKTEITVKSDNDSSTQCSNENMNNISNSIEMCEKAQNLDS